MTDKQQKDEPGLRYDSGKLRYDLLPVDSLEELVKVYTIGAAKYADRNWEKGMSWGRCFGSLLRHAFAFWRGEVFDQETKCHHMAHVAWNALTLVSFTMRGIGTDDRDKSRWVGADHTDNASAESYRPQRMTDYGIDR